MWTGLQFLNLFMVCQWKVSEEQAGVHRAWGSKLETPESSHRPPCFLQEGSTAFCMENVRVCVCVCVCVCVYRKPRESASPPRISQMVMFDHQSIPPLYLWENQHLEWWWILLRSHRIILVLNPGFSRFLFLMWVVFILLRKSLKRTNAVTLFKNKNYVQRHVTSSSDTRPPCVPHLLDLTFSSFFYNISLFSGMNIRVAACYTFSVAYFSH
jgi:hypothetical protein